MAVKKEGSLQIPGGIALDDAIKVLGVAGATLYGAIFLGYRSYYARFGLTPEEAGVTNSYILVRSVGFVTLAAVIAATIAGIAFLLNMGEAAEKESKRRANVYLAGAIGLYIPLVLFTLHYIIVSIWAIIIAFAPFALLIARIGGSRSLTKTTTLALVGIYAFLLPVIGIMQHAHERGDFAMQSFSVEPFQILGIPILDISAPRVEVSWIGDPEHRPAIFATQQTKLYALLVGSASGTTILLMSDDKLSTIVRLPTNMVAIQQEGEVQRGVVENR